MLLKQAAFWHKKSCRPTTAFSVATEVGSQKLKVGSRKSEVRGPKTLLGFRIICIGTRLINPKEDITIFSSCIVVKLIINGRIPVSLRRKHKGTKDHRDPNSRLRKSKSICFLQCSMCDAPSGTSQAMVKSKEMEMNWLETWLQNFPSVRVFFSLRPQISLWNFPLNVVWIRWWSFLVTMLQASSFGDRKIPCRSPRCRSRGWGDSAYERGGDARRKFWIKPLKETDLGVVQPFFDS